MSNLNGFILRMYEAIFSMKVLSGGCADCVLARKDGKTSDYQAGMSKEGDSPYYEYRRQLRECRRRGAVGFYRFEAK